MVKAAIQSRSSDLCHENKDAIPLIAMSPTAQVMAITEDALWSESNQIIQLFCQPFQIPHLSLLQKPYKPYFISFYEFSSLIKQTVQK